VKISKKQGCNPANRLTANLAKPRQYWLSAGRKKTRDKFGLDVLMVRSLLPNSSLLGLMSNTAGSYTCGKISEAYMLPVIRQLSNHKADIRKWRNAGGIGGGFQ
jgi:hypothetical protein